MSLSLFPARVPIGSVTLPNGQTLQVMASPEILRSLNGVFERIGGAGGMDMNALALLASFMPSPDQSTQQFVEDSAAIGVFSPPPAALDTMNWEGGFRTVPDYGTRQAVADMVLDRPVDYGAAVAELSKQVQELRNDLAVASNFEAAVAELRKYALELEIRNMFVSKPALTDWTRPGAIGSETPNTGAFTTLSASGLLSANLGLTVAGGNLTTRSIAETSTVANSLRIKNNTSTAQLTLGAGVTPASFDNTLNAFMESGGAGTGIGGIGSALYILANARYNSGWKYAATDYAGKIESGNGQKFSVAASGTAGDAITWIDWLTASNAGNATFVGSATITTGFGCNSKAAQTAYSSGGALAAYGAGANGFDSGANASALHAMVVSIRAALVANGIMS